MMLLTTVRTPAPAMGIIRLMMLWAVTAEMELERTVLVQLSSGSSRTRRLQMARSLQQQYATINGQSCPFNVSSLRAVTIEILTVAAQSGCDATLLCSALSAHHTVASCEPDSEVYIFQSPPLGGLQVPNDKHFAEQYGLEKIQARKAWEINRGLQSSTVVAVIDTGVKLDHPDLVNNLWTNPGEVPGNGIDDDGNGFVDDVHGYDFVDADGDPTDENGHGTHCAGIIGAEANNNIGVAGVTHGAKIMALRFLNADGSGSTSGAIRALDYALQMGVKISSNSWGGGRPSQAMRDSLSAAVTKGHLFVAAAGNAARDNDISPSYPCAYPHSNVICVASTDANDDRSTFSNWGLATVDIAAPGTAIISTHTSRLQYRKLSGTSMATPYVSGLAALMYDMAPTLPHADAISIILNSADKLPGLRGRVASSGRLNAAAALLELQKLGLPGPQPPGTWPPGAPQISTSTTLPPTTPPLQLSKAFLFLKTTASVCAEKLPYGTRRLAPNAGLSAYFSMAHKDVIHNVWQQFIYPKGIKSGEVMNITWLFASTKTVQSRVVTAVDTGEAVKWIISWKGTTITKSGVWRFSDSAGVAWKFRGGSSASKFSNDDGAWGAASKKEVNGDASSPSDFFGQGNFNTGDHSCKRFYCDGRYTNENRLQGLLYVVPSGGVHTTTAQVSVTTTTRPQLPTTTRTIPAMTTTRFDASRNVLFAVLTARACAESMPYGGRAPNRQGSAYFSNLYAGLYHTEWLQIVDPEGFPSSLSFTIHYKFSSGPKMLEDRMLDAASRGEPCTWTIHHNGRVHTKSGTYWFSDTARIQNKFSGSGTSFSADDGAWGGGSGKVNGNCAGKSCPQDYWGIMNQNSNDGTCAYVYTGKTSSKTRYSGVRSYVFVKPLGSIQPPTQAPPCRDCGICSFEGSETACSVWSNVGAGDNFDWSRKSGKTPSSSTGPSQAYHGKNYMYIETSSPRRQGDMARLRSLLLDIGKGASLSFRYHMYGSDIGSLTLTAVEVGARAVVLWRKGGNQGNTWRQATVDLSNFTGRMIKLDFDGVRGRSYRGDIAIDMVELKLGSMTTKTTTMMATKTSITATTTTKPFTTLTTTVDNAVPVRLVGGSHVGEGRLEVFYMDKWGTVCDDMWDTPKTASAIRRLALVDDWGTSNAQVVCRQLGFSGGKYHMMARFGKGKGMIWMDQVRCNGTETSLDQCQHADWGLSQCGHNEDVSVVCELPTKTSTTTTTDTSTLTSTATVTTASTTTTTTPFAGNQLIWEPFVAMTAKACAESLVYHQSPLDVTQMQAAFSMKWKDVLHDSWKQVIMPLGVPSAAHDFEIFWRFADVKTIRARFSNAETTGEPVVWNITSVNGAWSYSKKQVWRFSNRAGLRASSAKWTSSGSRFSADDGAWGASSIKAVNGNGGKPNDFVGIANWNSADSSWCGRVCTPVSASASSCSVRSMHKSLIYVKAPPISEVTCGFEEPLATGVSSEPTYCGEWATKRVVTAGVHAWMRRSGSTPSSRTGPGRASMGRYYVYTEVSSWRQGDVAYLTSPYHRLSIGASVSFRYHMHGNNIGTLQLLWSGSNSSWKSLWSVSGDRGDQWFKHKQDLSRLVGSPGPGIRLRLAATYGGGWMGDIALDELVFSFGNLSNRETTSTTTGGYSPPRRRRQTLTTSTTVNPSHRRRQALTTTTVNPTPPPPYPQLTSTTAAPPAPPPYPQLTSTTAAAGTTTTPTQGSGSPSRLRCVGGACNDVVITRAAAGERAELLSYRNSQSITLEVAGPALVQFSTFEAEASKDCGTDFIELANPVGTAGTGGVRFCGSHTPVANPMPATPVVAGSFLKMWWRTDQSVTLQGWVFTVQPLTVGCMVPQWAVLRSMAPSSGPQTRRMSGTEVFETTSQPGASEDEPVGVSEDEPVGTSPDETQQVDAQDTEEVAQVEEEQEEDNAEPDGGGSVTVGPSTTVMLEAREEDVAQQEFSEEMDEQNAESLDQQDAPEEEEAEEEEEEEEDSSVGGTGWKEAGSTPSTGGLLTTPSFAPFLEPTSSGPTTTSEIALPASTRTFPDSSVSTASTDSTFLMSAMRFEVDASSLQNLRSQSGLASLQAALEAVLSLPVRVVAACLAVDTVNGRCPASSVSGRPYPPATSREPRRLSSSGEVLHIDFAVDTSASSAAKVAEAALQLGRIEQGNANTLSQVVREAEAALASRGVVVSSMKALPAPPQNPGAFVPAVGNTRSTSMTPVGGDAPLHGPLPPETAVQPQTDTHSLLVVVVAGASSAVCLIVTCLCGVGWLLKRRRQFQRFDDDLDAFHDPSLETL